MVRSFGLKALSAWQEQPQASAEQLIIAFYQATNILPTSSVRGAYDALSSQGLMGLVGGPEFASRVSAYYAQDFNGVLYPRTPYRMEVRGVLPNEVQIAIRSNCASLAAEGLIVETLSEQCDIGLSTSHAQEILEDLISHPRMQFYLRQSISKDSVSIYVLGNQRATVTQLRERLTDIQNGLQ